MIPALSPAYLEALASPRGRGDLAPADVAGEVGSVVGGSGVRVTLRFATTTSGASYPPAFAPGVPSRIAAASWRAFGSAAPFGPATILADLLPGLTTDDAADLTPEDLLAPLGPNLPRAVARAAEHLVAALARALACDEAAVAAARVSASGVLVCRCLGVGDRVIRRAIRGGANDVPGIGLVTSAGHGCHSCWPDLRALIDEETVPGSVPHPPPFPPSLEPLPRAIDALVRPVWRAQGVVLGSVRVEGGAVRLSIASTQKDALSSALGAVAMARHTLRETIADDVRVEPDAAGGPAGSR